MTPHLGKFVLTAHVTFSVGWLGAVAVFIALAVTSLTTLNPELARAACLAMEISAMGVIVPFSVASLATGIVQALGTKWGLFKHYWILAKFVLTLAITILLLLHLQLISYLVVASTNITFPTNTELGLLLQLIVKAGVAVVGLLAVTTQSIYKPWGKIQFGRQNYQPTNAQDKRKSLGFYMLIGLLSLVVAFILIHLLGDGMSEH